MKIVVLAGGTSTERTVSITIRNRNNVRTLRQKGTSGDSCGYFLAALRIVDREESVSVQSMMWTAASEYMSAFNVQD